MNHQTPFLIALGMLTASALVVGVSGWILFARDHAARKLKFATAGSGPTASSSDDSGPAVPLTGASSTGASERDTSVTASVAQTPTDEHHHEVAEES
jgi:hypothetical protein